MPDRDCPMSNVFLNGFQRVLFQTADLGLGNAHLGGHFHLGFPLVKAQGQNMLLPLPQALQSVFQRNVFQPVFLVSFTWSITQTVSPPSE